MSSISKAPTGRMMFSCWRIHYKLKVNNRIIQNSIYWLNSSQKLLLYWHATQEPVAKSLKKSMGLPILRFSYQMGTFGAQTSCLVQLENQQVSEIKEKYHQRSFPEAKNQLKTYHSSFKSLQICFVLKKVFFLQVLQQLRLPQTECCFPAGSVIVN